MINRTIIICLAMCAIAPQLMGAVAVNEVRSIAPDAVVLVENLAGSVTVRGWDRPSLEITGTIDDDVEGLEIEGSEERLTISVEIPRRHYRSTTADLEIRLPQGCRVEVETVSASVKASGMTGELSVETVSGQIEISGPGGEVLAESVSGTVTVRGGRDDVQVATISSAIVVEGVHGSVELASVSGSIRVRGIGIERLEMENTSGRITAEGVVANPRVDIESLSGTVELRLPSGFDAAVSVSTFSGTIRNSFGEKARRCSKFAPGEELEFSRGSGSGRIRIENFSGTVILTTE